MDLDRLRNSLQITTTIWNLLQQNHVKINFAVF